MVYDYAELQAKAQHWAETALAAGRLHKNEVEDLLALDSRHAETLFSGNADRPLLVAFMGGTGVGKSSLLNRLAGQTIAKAGVQRPTSREVTLYHHQALALQQLPGGLPLDSVNISRHHNDRHSHIVWMDMPDFDSIEQGNHHLVLEWLPHIDILLYVVSPERYRDNKAWQLLLAEGAKHAWLFVMNQWDRGQALQFDDFKQQLRKAGFNDPLLFRTSCTEPDGDEFNELLQQLEQLSGRQSLIRLEQHNRQLRVQQLQGVLQTLQAGLQARDFLQLQNFYSEAWQKNQSSLQHGLAWPLQQLAMRMAEKTGQKADIVLWDAWAQSQLQDVLDALVLQAVQLKIPNKPLKTGLQAVKERAEKQVNYQAELAGREALLNPGNALQRMMLRITAVLETLAPLAAMAVVGYQVFVGYAGALDSKTYLGVDFAVHSVLLIALSWLIPFFLQQKIQPSLQKAALRGLQKGLQQALLAMELEIKEVIRAEQNQTIQLQQALAALLSQCEPAAPEALDKQSLLGRVLVG